MSSNISLVRCEVKTKFSFIGKTHVLQKKLYYLIQKRGKIKVFVVRGNGNFVSIAYNLQYASIKILFERECLELIRT